MDSRRFGSAMHRVSKDDAGVPGQGQPATSLDLEPVTHVTFLRHRQPWQAACRSARFPSFIVSNVVRCAGLH